MESGWRATWKSVVGEGWSRGCRCCCALGQTANPGSISPIAMTSRPTHSRDATLVHPRSNHPPPQSRSSAAPQLQRPSHPTFPFSASGSLSLSLSPLYTRLCPSSSPSLRFIRLSVAPPGCWTADPGATDVHANIVCTSVPHLRRETPLGFYPKRLFSRGIGLGSTAKLKRTTPRVGSWGSLWLEERGN